MFVTFVSTARYIIFLTCFPLTLLSLHCVQSVELFSMFKGCGMGPLLVLVSPCFRENVVVTCKIGSFLCSLDNLLQKNVIVFFFFFFFLKSNFKMALF